MAVKSFDGQYRFLSNFYPCRIEYEGLVYQSTEAAFQASKTLLITERERFTHLGASAAKRLGKRVKLRSDWDSVRLQVMEDLLRKKFTESLALKAQLLGTGDEELIEFNTWHDCHWGHCTCNDCKDKIKENHLGTLLMKIRQELRDGW